MDRRGWAWLRRSAPSDRANDMPLEARNDGLFERAFEEALSEAVQSAEIVEALGRASDTDEEFLRRQVQRRSSALWREAALRSDRLDRADRALRSLRNRLRNPYAWIVHQVVTLPPIQAAVAAAGLLVIALTFVLPFLRTTPGKATSARALILLGLVLLALPIIDCVVVLRRPDSLHLTLVAQVAGVLLGSATITLTIAVASGLLRFSSPTRSALLLTIGAALVMVGLVLGGSRFRETT
jgi:hypothetical protein